MNRDDLKEDPQSVYFPFNDEKTKIFENEDLKFCVSTIDTDNNDVDPLSDNIENNSIVRNVYEVIETKVRRPLLRPNRFLNLLFSLFSIQIRINLELRNLFSMNIGLKMSRRKIVEHFYN